MDSTISKIPLVDLKAQIERIEDDISDAIERVIASTGFIMGEEVKSFEREFASFCGAKYAIGVSSGTSALHLALKAVGVVPGDEVITVPHTFIATAEAIVHCGATPVFVDVEENTFTMDPEKLEGVINSKTKAILPVHLYGQCADMGAILDIAARYNIPVVEDAAQSHGATFNDRKAGTMGEAACFSFYPGKNLGAFGDAGAVTTNDPKVAEKVGRSRDHGRKEKYIHLEVGYGERLDALQAAILRVKLRNLGSWNNQRRNLAKQYDRLLADISEVTLPVVREDSEHVFHLYVIRVAQRDELLNHLRQQGIMAGVHYPVPLHLQPAFEYLGYRRGDFPATEHLANSVLSLPLYPELSETGINRVVEAIRSFYR